MQVRSRSRSELFVLSLYFASATIITAQQTLGSARSNNYAIFRASFQHLVSGKDLYALYPGEYWDLYKYSPTFALLFAPFSTLPYGAGLLAWNVLNAMALCASVVLLLRGRAAVSALCIVLMEALGALQNTQSNALVAGLMVLSVVTLERSRIAAGATAVLLGATVKVYPLCAGIFGLLSPARWRHLLCCAVVGAALVALPLVVMSPHTLRAQYDAWLALQRLDETKVGMAWLGGIMEIAFGHAIPHRPVQLAGTAWVVGTAWLVRAQWTDATIRRLLLSSLLIFAVVFNHMAESPTFVIAFTGIGVWWASMPRERWRDALVIVIVLVGSLGGSSLAPRYYRQHWHAAFQVKALVTVIGWVALQVDLVRQRQRVRVADDSDSDQLALNTRPVSPGPPAR